MHLLPSRGRPDGLQRFFDEGKPEQPGIVGVESDQLDNYRRVRMPSNWKLLDLGSERRGYVASVNALFEYVPDEPCYQMSSDDCVGRTPHWDTLLAEEASAGKIVWPNDTNHIWPGRCTFPAIPGEFCRIMGWFVHPKLWHMWCDKVWRDVQEILGPGGYRPDIVIEHFHYSLGKSEIDDTYNGRTPPASWGKGKLGKLPIDYDRTTYQEIDRKAIAERIRRARRSDALTANTRAP